MSYAYVSAHTTSSNGRRRRPSSADGAAERRRRPLGRGASRARLLYRPVRSAGRQLHGFRGASPAPSWCGAACPTIGPACTSRPSCGEYGRPAGIAALCWTARGSALKAGDRGKFNLWWSAATALGVLFLVGQAIAWQQLKHAGIFSPPIRAARSFMFSRRRTPSTCWAASRRWCTWMCRRSAEAGPAKRTAIDVTAIFWHFLDGLWLYLMVLFYVWG